MGYLELTLQFSLCYITTNFQLVQSFFVLISPVGRNPRVVHKTTSTAEKRNGAQTVPCRIFFSVNFSHFSCAFAVFPLETGNKMVYNTEVYAFSAENNPRVN